MHTANVEKVRMHEVVLVRSANRVLHGDSAENFDKHFDKTNLKRKEPKEILEKLNL